MKKKVTASKRKILQMLASADKEIVTLGIILALNRGVIWCKANIPNFGPGDCRKVISPPLQCEDFGFSKKTIGLMYNRSIHGIDCRYLNQFSSMDRKVLISLNK